MSSTHCTNKLELLNNKGHSIEVHYSHRPFDRLTVTIGGRAKQHAGTAWLLSVVVPMSYSSYSSNVFTLCDPVTLTFDLLT